MIYHESAQVFGIVSLVLALGILFNLDHARKLANELVGSVSGYILAGVLPTIFGAWLVTQHSRIDIGWHFLVGLIGWIMLLSGVFRLWFVDLWIRWMKAYADKLPVLFSLFGLMLGLLLCYIGFVSHHL